MNALIPLQVGVMGGQSVQTVNARELHAFLGVSRDFSSWTKDQIERARLVEDRDFIRLPENGERQNQGLSGQGRIDYHLTIEAAKHIAMLCGTDKGFEVRDYFIECERRVRNPGASLTRMDLIKLAMELSDTGKPVSVIRGGYFFSGTVLAELMSARRCSASSFARVSNIWSKSCRIAISCGLWRPRIDIISRSREIAACASSALFSCSVIASTASKRAVLSSTGAPEGDTSKVVSSGSTRKDFSRRSAISELSDLPEDFAAFSSRSLNSSAIRSGYGFV